MFVHNWMLSFEQAVVGPLMETLTGLKIVTLFDEEAVQPCTSVIVTVYVPVEPALIHGEVEELFQRYVKTPLVAQSCKFAPEHAEEFPVMETVGEV